MWKYFLSLALLMGFAHASLLDFNYLSQAKEAYHDKNYTKAETFYNKVQNDEAQFNVADMLYRQKKYKEAIEAYEAISEKKLKFKSLHNIGNSYAQMNKIDEGIKAYEEALKLKEDEDTKFNLELLKKKKKEQEKKDDKKKDDKNNKDKNNKDKKDQDQKNKDDKDNKDKDKKSDKKKDEPQKQDKKQDKKKDDKKEKDKMKAPKEQPPISNMEERKWQKMLNKRGVKTLMIPLPTKGEKRNASNPW